MNADMREYKEVLKAAVAKEREADKNWSWRIKAVTKTAARIGWGYLDFLNEDESFVVEVNYLSGEPTVVGTMPNGCQKYAFIGTNHWNDASTIEGGIALVIHEMAYSAHRTY